jgi:uncharacterized glyoxalase superfamily protein PhnB
MAVKPIPDGFHAVTPYLVVENVPRLIEFITAAFGGLEVHRTSRPDGRVMHATVQIGNSMVMTGEAMDRFPARTAMLYLYVPDVDRIYCAAVEAGGKSLAEPADQFYGDRTAAIEDPAGNTWWIATHTEDVLPEEIERRARDQERG